LLACLVVFDVQSLGRIHRSTGLGSTSPLKTFIQEPIGSMAGWLALAERAIGWDAVGGRWAADGTDSPAAASTIVRRPSNSDVSGAPGRIEWRCFRRAPAVGCVLAVRIRTG